MSSIALGLAFSSPLLFLLKRIPAPPVEPGGLFWLQYKTADKFWLVRRLRIFGCTGVRYRTQRENSGFTSSNMHLETPVFGQQKTPIKSGFLRNISFLCSFYGGEGEIRTLEPCYGLRDFQSRALDQLGDFSKLFAFKAYCVVFTNSLYIIACLTGKIKIYFKKR